MEANPPDDATRRPRLAAEIRDPTPAKGRSETMWEQGRFVASFHLPELGLNQLGHTVRGRLLLVWSRRPGVPYRAMIPLPGSCDPRMYVATGHNGIIEFVFARSGPMPSTMT